MYRDKITALAENKEWSREESLAKLKSANNYSSSMSHSKSASALSSSSYQQEGGSYQDMSYQTKEFRDQRDNYFNNLQTQNANVIFTIPF